MAATTTSLPSLRASRPSAAASRSTRTISVSARGHRLQVMPTVAGGMNEICRIRRKADGLKRKLCTMVLDDEEFTQIYGGEAVYCDGKVISR